ncbi:unnamed protein product, partial [Staurois parvus]
PLNSVWTLLIGHRLITCTLPRKKNSLAIHTKLSVMIRRWCLRLPTDRPTQSVGSKPGLR